MIPETTFRLDENSFVEPDIVFYRSEDGLENLKPKTALLAVEIADSSLAYDLGRKVRFYASFGVAEVWVINATSLETHQHSRPDIGGYTIVKTVTSDQAIAPPFAEELAVTLERLKLS